jgi:hypothetical protein
MWLSIGGVRRFPIAIWASTWDDAMACLLEKEFIGNVWHQPISTRVSTSTMAQWAHQFSLNVPFPLELQM